jgi:hypothetical protein
MRHPAVETPDPAGRCPNLPGDRILGPENGFAGTAGFCVSVENPSRKALSAAKLPRVSSTLDDNLNAGTSLTRESGHCYATSTSLCDTIFIAVHH